VEPKVSMNSSYAELQRQVKKLEDTESTQSDMIIAGMANTEEKFRTILDTVDVHLSLIDRDMNILWANRKTKDVFGREIVGKHCHNGCFGNAKSCGISSECIVKKAFLRDTVEQHEAQGIGADGSTIYLNGRAKVIDYDHDGKPLAVVRIYNDITEQKRAENDLKKSLLQLRRNLAGTIQAMALTVETRDPYTAGHQRRTSDIARSIAREMGLSKEQVDGIRMAGVIHDLGKISVPAEILSKPGKIGASEFSLIKDHPLTGYAILKGIDFHWPVAEIVRQHHERMDGTGYPYGLAGDEIMLEARVIGVADVIEAMSSHRPYRPSLGEQKAFEEIMEHRGGLYDADVVDTSIKLYNRGVLTFH